MSGEPNDAPLVDIELSDSSDASDEHSSQDSQHPSPPGPPATIGAYYPDGIPHFPPTHDAVQDSQYPSPEPLTTGPYYPDVIPNLPPADEPILIPGLDQTEEPDSTTESGWITMQTSATQPRDNSSPKNKTFIHPISEGGSVTWKDHDEFVFRKGKDRGPRVPAPDLPGNYKSNGPLKDFDFSKLRGNKVKKAPVTKFLDDYSGKQEQEPTELVTKILAYYNTNQDEYIKYLADQHLKRQGLNDTIRVQEQQIASIKEELTETAAVKKYSAERGEKIKELSQNLKDKDETINNLTFKIHKLEEGNFAIQDNENEELIKALMLKINELEEANRNRKEEDSKTSQDLDSAEQGQRVKELEQDVRDKEDIINDLFVKIHKLEEALVETARKQKGESSKPYKAAREKKMQELDRNVKDRDNTISALSLRIQELEEAGRARKEARSKVSQGLAPSARKMIDSAKAIKASLLESKVRCLLLQAKNYIDNKEYSAAAGVMDQAEVIMCQELPHLEVLRGKVLYRHGRAMYEMGFLPEAIQGFKSALKMGFDANCNEVDGDCVQPWLVKARAAQGKAVRLGYPA